MIRDLRPIGGRAMSEIQEQTQDRKRETSLLCHGDGSPLIEHARILELHEWAVAANLALYRQQLLSGLHIGYASTLPIAPSPGAQILTDLTEFNRVGRPAVALPHPDHSRR